LHPFTLSSIQSRPPTTGSTSSESIKPKGNKIEKLPKRTTTKSSRPLYPPTSPLPRHSCPPSDLAVLDLYRQALAHFQPRAGKNSEAQKSEGLDQEGGL
jgi:hypothetical protein